MQYKAIKNLNNISVIGLGTWAMGGSNWGKGDNSKAASAIQHSIEKGVTLIDTAPVYGSGHAEELIGSVLAGQRDKVIISTKCGLLIEKGGRKSLRRDDMQRELDQSCKRLKTDHIDIYFCHWPDPATPVEDAMETMLSFKEQGRISVIGLSNHPAELVKRALTVGSVDVLQDQLSILKQDAIAKLLPLCMEHDIGFFAYGPLGGGILSGKYRERPQFEKSDARSFFYPFYRDPFWGKTKELLDTISKIAHAHGITMPTVALTWVLAQQGVTSVLSGARDERQVEENTQAVQATLTSDELRMLSEAGAQVMKR